MNSAEKAILEIAKAILRESPGTTPQKAIRHAKDIFRNRGHYKFTAEEKTQHYENLLKNANSQISKIPDHIKETIRSQKKAEIDRKSEGRSLPTARFVSVGKASSK